VLDKIEMIVIDCYTVHGATETQTVRENRKLIDIDRVKEEILWELFIQSTWEDRQRYIARKR
jgi:hypothetical protein